MYHELPFELIIIVCVAMWPTSIYGRYGAYKAVGINYCMKLLAGGWLATSETPKGVNTKRAADF